MPGNYTANFKEKTGSTAGQEPLYLLEISHPQLAQPVRVVRDALNLRRGSGKFLNLPGSVDDAAPLGADFDFINDFPGDDPAAHTARFGELGGAFTRAGATATRVNAQGFIETVPADTLRIDHDPVTLERKGVMSEEARTNVALHSNLVSGIGYQNLTPAVITDDGVVAGTPPDGTASVRQFTFNGTAGGTLRLRSPYLDGVAGTTYTGSVYVRTANGAIVNASVDVNDGGNKAVVVDGQWQRVFTSFAHPTQPYRFFDFNCGVAAILQFWGVQVETGAFPTSYIPTTGAAVTRNAEVGIDPAADYVGNEGTIFAEGTRYAGQTTFAAIVSVNDGDTNDEIYLTNHAELARSFSRKTGGVAGDLVNIGAWPMGTQGRLAVAYKANDFAGSFNGGAVSADASVDIAAMERMNIGTRANGTTQWNGHIRRVAQVQKRVANASLQAIAATGLPTFSEEYQACWFDIEQPDDFENKLPEGSIRIDNIGRELVQWLEASGGGRGAQVRVMQVMRDLPDVLESDITVDLLQVTQKNAFVAGRLGYEDTLSSPALAAMYRPENAPGLF